MRKILVTGASGQLGRSLQRLGSCSPNCYHYTDRAELDITRADAVERALREGGYDVVINCAAYTQVERAEQEREEAEALNHLAVKNLAEAAAQTGATLIHISTDYLFDGKQSTPYTEQDTPHPLSVYGESKLRGEKAIAQSGCKALIIRTAWLYSEYGENFLKNILRLCQEREVLRVVNDQIGTPTYAGDLATALFSIVEGGLEQGNEGIYHFTNEGVASWYDFATEIAVATGLNERCRIEPCRTADYPTRAERPAYSVLEKEKIRHTFGLEIPHWRASMRYCLQRMAKG